MLSEAGNARPEELTAGDLTQAAAAGAAAVAAATGAFAS